MVEHEGAVRDHGGERDVRRHLGFDDSGDWCAPRLRLLPTSLQRFATLEQAHQRRDELRTRIRQLDDIGRLAEGEASSELVALERVLGDCFDLHCTCWEDAWKAFDTGVKTLLHEIWATGGRDAAGRAGHGRGAGSCLLINRQGGAIGPRPMYLSELEDRLEDQGGGVGVADVWWDGVTLTYTVHAHQDGVGHLQVFPLDDDIVLMVGVHGMWDEHDIDGEQVQALLRMQERPELRDIAACLLDEAADHGDDVEVRFVELIEMAGLMVDGPAEYDGTKR